MIEISKRQLIFIASLINTISGVVTDLYAPSLPQISHYFVATIYTTKLTIIIGIIGFSIGQLFFGWVLDAHGRKKALFFGIVSFVIISLLALLSTSIYQLLFIRFFQGFFASPAPIVARAVLIDVLVGVELNIAITYVIFSWGAGYILSPIIGGYLAYYYSWKSIFYFYAIYGSIFVMLIILLLPETNKLKSNNNFTIWNAINLYKIILQHKKFLFSTIIQGMCFSLLVIYSVAGPFMIEDKFQNSSIIFGNTGFIIGSVYLIGLLCNRFLLTKLAVKQIINYGFILMIIASATFLLTSLIFSQIYLHLIIVYISFIIFSVSLVFPNIAASSMRIFPNNAATAVAIQNSIILGVTGFSIWVVSTIKLNIVLSLPCYYFIVAIIITILSCHYKTT